jgi:hypothetical protein
LPIVYIHGVANRMDDPSYKSAGIELEKLLLRYVAPVIGTTVVRTAYWGEYGAQFRWNGLSRPRTILRGQGSDTFESSTTQTALLLASSGVPTPQSFRALTPRFSGLVPAGPSTLGPASPSPQVRLRDFSPEQLSDLLAATIVSETKDVTLRPSLLIAADEIAVDPQTTAQLVKCQDTTSELNVVRTQLERITSAAPVAQGADQVWSGLIDRLSETLSRVESAPAAMLSTLVAEWRPKLNDLVTLFFGDVFTYLAQRGDANKIGAIPKAVITAMREAKNAAPSEPHVVVTHSMGGQILYDLVTNFLPASASDLRVDFWCATASQVGLFEEMKLFSVSSEAYCKKKGNKAPLPDSRYLGHWWNVWDHNDFLSYTCAPIFEGVDDESYNCGASLLDAHGEYLSRPSFHRKLASKVEEAKKANWRRSTDVEN